MSVKSMSIGVETVSTTQQLPLGFEFEEDSGADGNGPKVWVYVQNGDVGALAIGSVCVRKTGATTKIVEKSEQSAPEHNLKVVGVAQHAIPASSFGFIQKKGRALVLADTGGITVDHVLTVGNAVDGTADSVVETTLTTGGFGVVLASAVATATGACYIDCRG